MSKTKNRLPRIKLLQCREEFKNGILSVSYPRLPNEIVGSLIKNGVTNGEMMYFLNEHYLKIADKEHQSMMELFEKKGQHEIGLTKLNTDVFRVKWKTIKWLGVGILTLVILSLGMVLGYTIRYSDYSLTPSSRNLGPALIPPSGK